MWTCKGFICKSPRSVPVVTAILFADEHHIEGNRDDGRYLEGEILASSADVCGKIGLAQKLTHTHHSFNHHINIDIMFESKQYE